MRLVAALSMFGLLRVVSAQQGNAAPVALTIYNQDFAVARTSLALDLKRSDHHPCDQPAGAGFGDPARSRGQDELQSDGAELRCGRDRPGFHAGEV